MQNDCAVSKIGIISLYYQNRNMGGLLQAFALCSKLQELGYFAEQITFDRKASRPQESKWKSFLKSPFQYKLRSIKRNIEKIFFRLRGEHKHIMDQIVAQNVSFDRFALSIPHSNTIYSQKELPNCVNNYSIFITGSDQVWNMKVDGEFSAFFLDFVPNDKFKMSYAASIAMTDISENEKNRIKEYLKSFHAISVRESRAVELLQPLVSVPVALNLDPTMLLSRQDWDGSCGKRLVEDEYLFCYFLGERKKLRDIAKRYAKINGLKIVFLPYSSGGYHACDRSFGDIRLFGITPFEFVSLVKYAKAVFTDSFHGSVFSILYHKDFFVFNKDYTGLHNSRIYSLLEQFNLLQRFCDTTSKEKIDYMASLPSIDYEMVEKRLQKFRADSVTFLRQNIDSNLTE